MIKPKPIAKLSNKGVPAFTILESLVTLGITCLMVMSLSGSLNGIFQSVEETLFFLSFENLYRDTQTLANVNQRAMTLTISEDAISNGVSKVSLPRQVKVGDTEQIVLSKEGGNSSLGKVVFQLQDKEIYYQLYLGSGKYKKTESSRLHTPREFSCLGLNGDHYQSCFGRSHQKQATDASKPAPTRSIKCGNNGDSNRTRSFGNQWG